MSEGDNKDSRDRRYWGITARFDVNNNTLCVYIRRHSRFTEDDFCFVLVLPELVIYTCEFLDIPIPVIFPVTGFEG